MAWSSQRPLDPVGSIKVKLGLLVGVSAAAAGVLGTIGERAGVPFWTTVPVTIAIALAVTQWLAHGMVQPLSDMRRATAAMASGDYSRRVVATSQDEVGALAKAFNSMADDLAATDSHRRQLLATVSHELRTPLAAQGALLENLVDGVVTPDDAALTSALEQNQRLTRLVNDLLDLSRSGQSSTALRLSRVALEPLLTGLAEQARLSERAGPIEVTVTPTDLTVLADEARLAQVIANLVDNAVRHGPPGQPVHVRADQPDSRTWRLEVVDAGAGIPPERAREVFSRIGSRFGTGDDSAGGSGLGLGIARWACELHGGTLSVVAPSTDPDARSGNRIQATFPLRHTPSTSTSTPTPTPKDAIVNTPPPATQAAPPPPPKSPQATKPARQQPVGLAVNPPRWWPERPLPPQVGVLAASGGVGLLAGVLLPHRGFGLSSVIVIVLAGTLLYRVSVRRNHAWTRVAAALCAGLALLLLLRASYVVAVLAVLSGLTVTAATLTGARQVLGMVLSAVAWPLSAARGIPLLSRTVTAASQYRQWWPILRTTAVSIVVVMLFGGLFASADALFGTWAGRLLPQVRWDDLILRGFVAFFVAGSLLAGCYLALNPPQLENVHLRATRRLRTWEWLVPSLVLLAVFVAFLASQATVALAGHEYVQRTTGISYADYVHQGFWQLTAVTGLVLVVTTLIRRVAPLETAADRTRLRIVLSTLAVLTLGVVASALYRMAVYQEAYGFTQLRLFVDGFELWLGVLVVFTLVAGLTLRFDWLGRAALVSGAVFTIGYGALNPDAFIAAQNIERYERTGKLDATYLGTLSPDAVPVVASSSLDPGTKVCVLQGMAMSDDDLLAWNLGRSRADDALSGVAGLTGDRSRVVC